MRGARPRVYLAGPITGLSFEGATDWRDEVTDLLLPNIVGVSPMRGKDYLRGYSSIGGSPEDFNAMGQAMSTPKAIVTRDRNDVETCDAVIMNLLDATKISIGTMIEVGWADAYRKPLILVIEPEGKQHAGGMGVPDTVNPHWHGMVTEIAGYSVTTLEEAAHVAQALFYRRAA